MAGQQVGGWAGGWEGGRQVWVCLEDRRPARRVASACCTDQLIQQLRLVGQGVQGSHSGAHRRGW